MEATRTWARDHDNWNMGSSVETEDRLSTLLGKRNWMEPTQSLAVRSRFQGRAASRVVRMGNVIYGGRKVE